MAARNTATANWEGSKDEGRGRVVLGTAGLEGSYTFASRFAASEDGTNPEELVAGAIAACFGMATTANLDKEGITVEGVETKAEVTLKMIDGKPTLTKIQLTSTVNAPGADESTVREAADAAKAGCPISRALGGVDEIALDLSVNA